MLFNFPILKQKIYYDYIKFGEFKRILFIICETEISIQTKIDLLNNYVFSLVGFDSEISNIDKLHFLFHYFITSFDSTFNTQIQCKNERCKINNSIKMSPKLNNIDTSVTIGDKTVEITQINEVENKYISDIDFDYINDEIPSKTAKLFFSEIGSRIEEYYTNSIVDFGNTFSCKFCGTENDINLSFTNYGDLFYYINYNYGLEWYYNVILIMKYFGYSILELDNLYLSEIELLINKEKTIRLDK